MISDFNVPGWSAIQSNRSGFEAEVVEAQQTGGSIKGVQKAHFFMSVAKTADQKEASLASIKIIKARMVKDGQIFRDCIFNNDTMQISIRDDRYVGGYNINKKKVADDVIAEGIEKHASGNAGLLNSVLSNALPQLSPEDEVLRTAFMKEHKIEDIKPVENNTEHVDTLKENETIYVEKQPDYTVREPELLHEHIIAIEELYTVKDIIPVQAMSEPTGLQTLMKINEDFNQNSPFDWSGETFTTAMNENEVKLEDIKVKQEEIEPKLLEIISEDVLKVKKISVEEENNIAKLAREKLLLDPDDESLAQKNVTNMLIKDRVNLNIIIKE
jgi:hypothetical protein